MQGRGGDGRPHGSPPLPGGMHPIAVDLTESITFAQMVALRPRSLGPKSEVNTGMVYGPTGQEARHADRVSIEAWEATATLEAEAESHADLGNNEEALRVRIIEKWQRRTMQALAREQSRADRTMAGLPPQRGGGRQRLIGQL